MKNEYQNLEKKLELRKNKLKTLADYIIEYIEKNPE